MKLRAVFSFAAFAIAGPALAQDDRKDERNIELSAERAKAIETMLRERDPDLGHVDVRYFGSKEPLVPTPPNVPERRNRRAESMVL